MFTCELKENCEVRKTYDCHEGCEYRRFSLSLKRFQEEDAKWFTEHHSQQRKQIQHSESSADAHFHNYETSSRIDEGFRR